MSSSPTILREPLTGPAVWRGSELDASRYVYRLSASELDGLERIRRTVAPGVVGLGGIDAETVPMPELAGAIDDWVERMERGIGFVVVRGLDLDGWTDREVAIAYYALGRQLGDPVSQNTRGHLIGHVRDTGRDIFTDPTARGYEVNIALPFHTDTSTDVLALCCLRRARTGGKSSLAPLQSIYNEVLARRPDLIDTFYRPFAFDCRGEAHPDGGPFYERVLASMTDGVLSLRHNSGYARSAAGAFPGCPSLTDDQDELLHLIDGLASDPDLHVRFHLEPGDILFANNYVVAHSRSAFEDHEDPARRRHLLRLWLVLHHGRRLAPDFDNRAGLASTADVVEDGLEP